MPSGSQVLDLLANFCHHLPKISRTQKPPCKKVKMFVIVKKEMRAADGSDLKGLENNSLKIVPFKDRTHFHFKFL